LLKPANFLGLEFELLTKSVAFSALILISLFERGWFLVHSPASHIIMGRLWRGSIDGSSQGSISCTSRKSLRYSRSNSVGRKGSLRMRRGRVISMRRSMSHGSDTCRRRPT
jgi:hypothetical protein